MPRSNACGLPPGEKCAPAPRNTIARTAAPRVASCSAARRRSSPSSTDKVLERLRKGGGRSVRGGGGSCQHVQAIVSTDSQGFKLRCGQLWVVQLDDGHAVRLVHPHAHQAWPCSARRPRPERAHHHKRAVGGGGGQLGVAAGQKRWWQGGEAGAEPLRLAARSRRRADIVEPRVGSFANGGGGRQAAGQMAALGISDAGAVGTDGHSRGVDQQQRTRAACLAAA
eukprot:scaffold37554_cov68-Phaeocystis_antarctica.AAC.2